MNANVIFRPLGLYTAETQVYIYKPQKSKVQYIYSISILGKQFYLLFLSQGYRVTYSTTFDKLARIKS